MAMLNNQRVADFVRVHVVVHIPAPWDPWGIQGRWEFLLRLKQREI